MGKFSWQPMLGWAALWCGLALLVASCGSHLPRELTNNRPQSGGVPLDASKVNFVDMLTGETINLAGYMEATGKDSLLLTFGSKSCGACMKKAKVLTDEVIGQHPLFLTDSGQDFEIIGVNTDVDARERLLFINDRYPFIRWSDPGGVQMLNYFMPAGKDFAVPLTVMITRQSITWAIAPDEPLSVAELIEQVERTLAGNFRPGDDGGDGDLDPTGGITTGDDDNDDDDGQTTGGITDGDDDDDRDPGGGDVIKPVGLAQIGPGRLKSVPAAGCGRSTDATVFDVLDPADVQVVHVLDRDCENGCAAEVNALETALATCHAAFDDTRCSGVVLASGGVNGQACSTGAVFQGGGEFYDVFTSHFDWAGELTWDETTWLPKLPEFRGPLTFVFNRKSGELVHSAQGELDAATLGTALADADLQKELAPGLDFPFYTPTTGDISTADWLRQADYSVVMAWGAYPQPCTSCMAEMTAWSRPGDAVDYCAALPGRCQLAGLEVHRHDPFDSNQTLDQHYEILMNGAEDIFVGINPAGIRVPIYLDNSPAGGDDDLKRLFQGYMMAKIPEWNFEYRTFIYDREGKLVGAFKAEEPEDPAAPSHLLDELKKLIEPTES